MKKQMNCFVPIGVLLLCMGMAGFGWADMGRARYDYWLNIAGLTVDDLRASGDYPDSPSGGHYTTVMQSSRDWADQYGARLQAYLIAPVTGNYTFYICTDDYGELWLSTDDNPSNIRMICKVPGYAAFDTYDTYTDQTSASIPLQAGQIYYIMALQKEDGGGDHVQVAWSYPGQARILIGGNAIAYPNPRLASQPVPADQATYIPVEGTTLGWTAPLSGIVTNPAYNVYLYSDPNYPTQLLSHSTATTVGTGALKYETTYFWRVDVRDPNNGVPVVRTGDVWSFTTVSPKPVFDPPYGYQPVAITATLVGDTVVLTAQAGVAPGEDATITYKWYQNGVLLDGETGTTLTLADLSEADNGTYVCRATNSAGSTDSAPAKVKAIRLIGHWPLDGNLNDVVGGQTGEGVGSPAFVEGLMDQAVTFNGLGNQAVKLPSIAMGTGTDFTLMFWEKQPENAPDNNMYMCASGSPSGHERLYMWAWRNPSAGYDCDYYGNLYVNFGGNWGPIPSANQYLRGQWHHHALTYNTTTMNWHWYVDGVDKGFRTLTTAFPGFDTHIFLGNRYNMLRPFTGAMDDFRLYNYELPREVIAALYAEGSGNSVCLDPVPGDLNDDCRVNLLDFAEMALNWLQCNKVPESACAD